MYVVFVLRMHTPKKYLYLSVLLSTFWVKYVSRTKSPASSLHKSIAGRYRPVRVADGPITARYRFM